MPTGSEMVPCLLGSIVYKAANKYVGHRLELSAMWRQSDMMQAFIVVLINCTSGDDFLCVQ